MNHCSISTDSGQSMELAGVWTDAADSRVTRRSILVSMDSDPFEQKSLPVEAEAGHDEQHAIARAKPAGCLQCFQVDYVVGADQVADIGDRRRKNTVFLNPEQARHDLPDHWIGVLWHHPI